MEAANSQHSEPSISTPEKHAENSSPLSPPEERNKSNEKDAVSNFSTSGIKNSAGDPGDAGENEENSVPEEANPPKQDVTFFWVLYAELE